MRLMLNFLDALRKVRLKLSMDTFGNNNTAIHNLPSGKSVAKSPSNPRITIGEESGRRVSCYSGTPSEWGWTQRSQLEVDKRAPEEREPMWHNIRKVLLMCGGQKLPDGIEVTRRAKDASRLVDVLEAQRFVSQVFAAMDVPKQAASEMADVLIAADYMGHRSMGIHRLPAIAADLLNGTVVGTATPSIMSELEAIGLVDGHNAPGPVVANFCMDLAIQKAREVGIGWVSACHSNCIGMACWYACQALEQRMIGLCMTNGPPTLVPCGGVEPILGENPIACAASGAHEQFLADFGMGACSVEELELSYCNGWSKQVPKQVALDSEGQETTSTAEALKAQRIRAFHPEHKGFGLAGMVDILCGVMTGARYANLIQRRGVFSADNAPADLGQVFIAIDPMRFCSNFEDRLGDFHRVLRRVTPNKAGNPVLVPGDKEMQHMEMVDDQGGFTMTPCTLSVLGELAEKFQIAPLKMKGISQLRPFASKKANNHEELQMV
ncbi:uncharacterized oxidoreductase YjmC [Drosophila bipectinata]|uniref:uncharacterized oxidoreductase YjmC n=1 Tax=Drosophila bipectinata TaxID=42026 RepID=UPI001C8A073C|nr:uncharacterized oxidoreductase YjmC [Drosophila bipectinata]